MNQRMDFLLELNDLIISQAYGYWVKFDVKTVPKCPERPHGVNYSLTLHNNNGARVLGFDNAHGVNKYTSRYHRKIIEWDHEHKLGRSEMIYPYEFESPEKLVSDFWTEVDNALKIHEE